MIQAINGFFSDRSRTQEQTLEGLIEARELINELIAAIREDLG